MQMQDATSQQEQDIDAIHEIVRKVQEGWNSGDGAAFAAPFAPDADYVIVNGVKVKGRAVIEAGHQQIFDTIYKGSNNSMTVEDIRFIRPDVAIAHVHAHLKFYIDGALQEGKARSTWVLSRSGRQWAIDAFQNTPIAPDPPPGQR